MSGRAVNESKPELIGRALVPFFVGEDDAINESMTITQDQEQSFRSETTVEVREFRDGYYQPVVKREGTGHIAEGSAARAVQGNAHRPAQMHGSNAADAILGSVDMKPARHMRKLMTPEDMMRLAAGKDQGAPSSQGRGPAAPPVAPPPPVPAVSAHPASARSEQVRLLQRPPQQPVNDSQVSASARSQEVRLVQRPPQKPLKDAVATPCPKPKPAPKNQRGGVQLPAPPVSGPVDVPLSATAGRSAVVQGGQSIDVMQLFAAAQSHQAQSSSARAVEAMRGGAQAAAAAVPPPLPGRQRSATLPNPQPAQQEKHEKKQKNKRNKTPPKQSAKSKQGNEKKSAGQEKKAATSTHFAMPASMSAPSAESLPMPSFAFGKK